MDVIQHNYKLQVYLVSTAARLEPGPTAALSAALGKLEPVGETTRLGACVRRVLADMRGTPPAAIVGFEPHMLPARSPYLKGKVERLNRTVEDELALLMDGFTHGSTTYSAHNPRRAWGAIRRTTA